MSFKRGRNNSDNNSYFRCTTRVSKTCNVFQYYCVFDKVLMREKTVLHMNAALLKKAAGSRAGGQATGPFQTNTFTTFVPLKETASAQCS